MTVKNLSIYTGLFLFLLIHDLSAREMEIIQSRDVMIQFEKPLGKVAQEVMKIYPSVKKELEDTFKTSLTFTPTVVLVKDSGDFQDMFGKSPVVAVALSAQNRIIIDNSRMKTYPFTLTVTLKHELCHLFLHHAANGNRLPRWLNEGISQWVSDGIAEVIIGEHKDLLNQAVLSGRVIPLRDLEKAFPADRRSLLLAYEESKSVVEYIDAEFGSDGIVRMVTFLSDGSDIDSAFRKGVGISINELEKRWNEHLRRKVTWFSYMSDHLYQILFALAALLLTYGFIRVLVKKWRYRDEDEEEAERREG